MSFTVREYFGEPFNGRLRHNLQVPGVINSDSVVVITATEYNPGAVPPIFRMSASAF